MTWQKKYPSLNEIVSLKGKKALVTGGAMGIGLGVAYRLAEAGASVTIADLNPEKGQKAVQDLCNLGYQVFFCPCDVSNEKDVANTVSKAQAQMGGLDILVNNAGIFPPTPILQTTGDDIEKILAVNLKGLVYCIRETSRKMIEQKRGGSIINIASIDSLHPSHKGMSIYDASKGAVLTLTKAWLKI
jgi:2-deoxy-D-gluconate 3-dehydrogenase